MSVLRRLLAVPRARQRVLLAAGSSAALLLGGCGGGDNQASEQRIQRDRSTAAVIAKQKERIKQLEKQRQGSGGKSAPRQPSAAAEQPAPSRRTPATSTGSSHATLATFAGHWSGHTRTLTITRDGQAKESIGSGCCDPVVDLRLTLSHPRGNHHVATVAISVTSVQIHDDSAYNSSHPAPHVGEKGKLKLRHGVITESVTETNYCNQAAADKGSCGA